MVSFCVVGILCGSRIPHRRELWLGIALRATIYGFLLYGWYSFYGSRIPPDKTETSYMLPGRPLMVSFCVVGILCGSRMIPHRRELWLVTGMVPV